MLQIPLPEFFPIQINLLGDTLLVDTDGETLSEKDASAKWGAYSTPTIMALQPELNTTMSASQQAVAIMRGAFPAETTLTLLTHLVAWFDVVMWNLNVYPVSFRYVEPSGIRLGQPKQHMMEIDITSLNNANTRSRDDGT